MKSDAQGFARFAPGLSRGTGGLAPALVSVETGAGDYAFLDLTAPAFDLSDRGVSGRAAPGPVDVFAWLDRGATGRARPFTPVPWRATATPMRALAFR
ncbi:MAG: hypothetical protein HPM95_20685 [Alphaproteobacteria bacterium]|nr:hypothetical protein [Alphaproteobacteria bacterium]